MKREIDLQEISDGKLYSSNDMVKADCGNCEGCHACCCGMGTSILLDPLDVFRLTEGLGKSFEELLTGQVELNVVDGIILPNLKMQGPEEACAFLNREGRCSIHAIRPGFCRLFPLGRFYENGSFQYFLQVHECRKENRSKVKVKKWIDTPDVRAYEKFVNDWHYFLKEAGSYLEEHPDQDKAISLFVLRQFYLLPYDKNEEFYVQFSRRLQEGKEKIQNL